MENQQLRARFEGVIAKLKEELFNNKKCIAAYLLGSASHDQIWEWSDIQIAVVLDDGYKGRNYLTLLENDILVALNIYTITEFKRFIESGDIESFLWKAFIKSTRLFSKNCILDELIGEAFIIGDAERNKEMLLGFSGAVYYLHKAEKNMYIKKNMDNVIFFIAQIVENIAWIEIFKNKKIPEREIIPHGKSLNPDIFACIYDPLFTGSLDDEKLKKILDSCVAYLLNNTEEICRPVLLYLRKHGNLEFFRYETRPHGFGLHFIYEWLVRCGIVQRYGIPEKISLFGDPVNSLSYKLKSH